MSSSGAEMYTYFLSLLSHSFDAEKGVENSGSAFPKTFPNTAKTLEWEPFLLKLRESLVISEKEWQERGLGAELVEETLGL